MSRGLRNLARTRPATAVATGTGPADSAPTDSATTGSATTGSTPTDAPPLERQEPKQRRRGRRAQEPQAITPPLPTPTPITPPLPNPTPITPARQADPTPVTTEHPTSRPLPAPRVQLDDTRPAATTPAEPDQGRSGRRFGARKSRDTNDYVDWVSKLGND